MSKISKTSFGLINGPNLSKLGDRDQRHYGAVTLEEIEKKLRDKAASYGYGLISFQSNVEGYLIDFIQNHENSVRGWVVNPGALMMSGYPLADALMDSSWPFVEVHISQIFQRETQRHHSVLAHYAYGLVVGFGAYTYELALSALMEAQKQGLKLVSPQDLT
ncbi:MAG: type II 3-dehydroquinate dehydratase [Proteobacteria bacterium]|nr:type II 3-dehydroquinate dehydratase [Pseudomonadota bacterium]